MIDCLPTIRELIQGWPRDRVLEVLDVRTGSGAGANLLATLHRSVFFGVQMKVDAMDISSAYKAYADVHFPDITYAVGNLFDLPPDRTWDLIICSHVIEHLTDPAPLIGEISRRARHWAVFCAPFEEKNLLEGHLISITAKMIAGLRIQPLSVKVMTSPGWKHPVDEQSEVVVFVVKGHGARGS
jgi:2-polyprenyl-3-methyl-5-hydroxy-6-metoxy-1,4-benzoquinol methylase